MKRTAKFLTEITVLDNDKNVELSVFKHENGGMFAIDSSYIEQSFDDDENVVIQDPLNEKGTVVLSYLT